MKLKAKMPAGWRLELLKYIVAALLVVLIGSVIILSQGNSPAEAFRPWLSARSAAQAQSEPPSGGPRRALSPAFRR